jgi:uncharacterized repeat protein (TIGR03803 family)
MRGLAVLATLSYAEMLLIAVVAAQSIQAQNYPPPKYEVLYSSPDLVFPRAGLVQDSAGNLYGSSEDGGIFRSGSVFKVDNSGAGTVLYSFTGKADGGYPEASLILDSEGNLYGTTPYEGSGSCPGGIGCGVVFELNTNGVEVVLHSFSGLDGMYPFAGLIRDPLGNLYGTTQYGGTNGAGTVFKIDASGVETVLYSFTAGSDGAQPLAGLVEDKAGNLYGTTSTGGAPPCNCGTVFKLDMSGNATVLHSFSWTDGAYPLAALTLDRSGNLYGTSYYGGASGFGTVFELDTAGKETVLYSFTGGKDGGYPRAPLLRYQGGNLYSTTQIGGVYGYGTVFQLNAKRKERVLHSFTYLPDGQTPYAGLIQCAKNTLCGTTEFGGSSGNGVVFKITR